MLKNKLRKDKKGGIAISQIVLLIISIVAISYAIGSSVGFVSAQVRFIKGPDGSVWEKDIGETYWACIEESCTFGTLKTEEELCESFGADGISAGICKSTVRELVPGVASSTDPRFPAQQLGSPTPSTATNPVTQVARGVVVREVTNTLRNRITGENIPPEQIDDIRSALKGAGASDEIIDSILSDEDLTPEAAKFLKEMGTGVGPSASPSLFKRFITGGTLKQSLATGVVVGIVIVTITFFSVGIRTGDWGRAREAALRVAIGAGAGLGAYAVAVAFTPLGPAGWIAAGFVILGVWASKFLSREQERTIVFQCKPWQPQTGGDNCGLCDDGDFPCTEYQCRSLGTGCELINKDTDDPRCIYKDSRDVDPPTITPWTDILTEDYRYDPLPRGQTGVEIKFQNEECLPAFEPFAFGVELDKDGYCRIDFQRTADFSDMQFDFGGINIFITQHSQTMSFPGVAHLEQAGLNITNAGEFEFYVRCQAASNGKANREEFLFKFCTEKGPDTTSPIIRGFNWIDGSPIAYFDEGEEREVGVQVYTHEPSACRWDHEDKDFKDMENQMICSDSLTNFNAQLSYTCSGKLTGLENREENKFFFRCNDTFGNVNIQSTTLTLVGTRPLVIDSVSPNNTLIKGSTGSIKVTLDAITSAGYREGESRCEYSNTGESGTYVKFSDTDSHQHSTNVWLEPRNYNYFIRCIDLAGNSDTKEITFTVETDTQAPVVVRAFHSGSSLKLITNEEAECVYSTSNSLGCSYLFEDGIKMTVNNDIEHTTNWDPNTNFYIKCQDEFDNRPFPNQCSIIVRPFEI